MSYRALGVVVAALSSFSLLTDAAQVEEAARTPIAVPGVENAVAAAVGSHAYFVLLRNGTVLSWGVNNAGQLGNGGIGPAPGAEPGKTMPYVVQGKAEPIAGLADVAGIAAGSDHALAVTRDASVWSWGR